MMSQNFLCEAYGALVTRALRPRTKYCDKRYIAYATAKREPLEGGMTEARVRETTSAKVSQAEIKINL